VLSPIRPNQGRRFKTCESGASHAKEFAGGNQWVAIRYARFDLLRQRHDLHVLLHVLRIEFQFQKIVAAPVIGWPAFIRDGGLGLKVWRRLKCGKLHRPVRGYRERVAGQSDRTGRSEQQPSERLVLRNQAWKKNPGQHRDLLKQASFYFL
jgi:hypothetical protein